MADQCVLCGNQATVTLWSVPEANFCSSIPRFDVVRCAACGLSFMDPFPGEREIEELYVRDNVYSQPSFNPYRRSLGFRIFEPLYRKYGDDLTFIVSTCRRTAGLSAGAPARVLDVGCSAGPLLDRFRELMPRASLLGLDIDPHAREAAPPRLRDCIRTASLAEADLEPGFDVITLRFVVEHLLDPAASLSRARELLRPGGVLMLSTPDMDSAVARQEKGRWNLVNDPRFRLGHVTWFNRASMAVLADRLGLRLALCRNRGPVAPHLSPWLRETLERLLGRDPVRGRFISNYALRMTWAVFVDGLLSERLNLGESIYAFLVKE